MEKETEEYQKIYVENLLQRKRKKKTSRSEDESCFKRRVF